MRSRTKCERRLPATDKYGLRWASAHWEQSDSFSAVASHGEAVPVWTLIGLTTEIITFTEEHISSFSAFDSLRPANRWVFSTNIPQKANLPVLFSVDLTNFVAENLTSIRCSCWLTFRTHLFSGLFPPGRFASLDQLMSCTLKSIGLLSQT